MDVFLAQPRGFCAGVDRAIEIVELALDAFGPPVYVRHEIVHNNHVVNRLREMGARFVDDLAQVPERSILIFSAHGVSPAVRDEARRRNLRTIDATCPLVTKVHIEAVRLARSGYRVLLIGHRTHVEVEGTLGEAPDAIEVIGTVREAQEVRVPDPDRVACVTQTTLSVDDTKEIVEVLRRRFPGLREPKKDDICYATQNRQNAVKELCEEARVVLVVGSPESSNSNRLVEVAVARGARAHLIQNADDIRGEWLAGAECVGVTAGASAPEDLVRKVIERLKELGAISIREIRTAEESIEFALPPELRHMAAIEVRPR
ncbi:MAG: 4-hydroxy-3-methylbut-2-enyl diphosphate reductase [Nitrospirae bacterium]|nr:4-hydroxy-3-methylbut-2-enyl diphosphate reductase [Nitrospirota bacterium]